MNTIKLMETKEIDLSLKALVKAIKLTTERVQTIAIQAAAYSFIMRDPSIANKLYEAVSTNKSLRKDSLVKYLEVYSHLAFDTKEKKFKFHVNPKIGDTFGALPQDNEADLISHRWDEAKKEPEIVSEWDMEAQVRAFLAKMHKIVGDKANTIKNRDALASVETTFNRWSAEATLKACNAMDDAEQKQEIATTLENIVSEPQVKVRPALAA